MPDIEWTGDSMARLIWRCRDCGEEGEAQTDAGIARGNRHRIACPSVLYPILPLLDQMKTSLIMAFAQAARKGEANIQNQLMVKIETVEKVEKFAKEMYES